MLGKVDYAVNNRNNLTLQYNMHRWDSPNGVQTQPVISVAPSANGNDIVKTDFALATINTVLSRALAERGACADRAGLRAAAAQLDRRARHDGHGRHRHRHPELPAPARSIRTNAASSSSTT